MISKKTKYALKALMDLTDEYKRKEPVLISKIASRNHIPKKFLELILLQLKNKGFLMSKKGKGGGYLLAKSPKNISLGEVLRLLEGPLAPLSCLSRSAYRKCEECRDETACGLRSVMREVQEATNGILDKTSLEDMMNRARQAEMMYFI